MEHVIQLHIEKLPEGVYLTTSDDVQDLIAQGRTIQETLEIALDVAKKLMGPQSDAGFSTPRKLCKTWRPMWWYPVLFHLMGFAGFDTAMD